MATWINSYGKSQYDWKRNAEKKGIFSEWNYVCYFFFVSNKKFSIAQFFETCDCSELRIRTTFKNFTTSNTGLDKNNQFPELGSVFKAAFIKSASWWFAKTAITVSDAHPGDPCHQIH